jgi:hypothetical protein
MLDIVTFALNCGLLVVLAMITVSIVVGTDAGLQFPLTLQFVLDAPVHVNVCGPDTKLQWVLLPKSVLVPSLAFMVNPAEAFESRTRRFFKVCEEPL